jgi:DNA-directed RNA polymerase subunit RPC12/RpoP
MRTTSSLVEASNLLPRGYWCPYCGDEASLLDYNSNFSETTFGRISGTYNVITDTHKVAGQDVINLGDYEETNYEYLCRNCGELLRIEDLLTEPPREEKKEKEKGEEEKDYNDRNLAERYK